MKDPFKQIRKAQRKLEAAMRSWSRMWVAHPDLCIFLQSYPRLGYRYLRKRGAARGFHMLSLGWMTFSVRV